MAGEFLSRLLFFNLTDLDFILNLLQLETAEVCCRHVLTKCKDKEPKFFLRELWFNKLYCWFWFLLIY